MVKNTRQKDRDKKPIKKKVKPEKISEDFHSIYIFDKETNQWKVYNPSGSTAYNYLTKDEWGWLDLE